MGSAKTRKFECMGQTYRLTRLALSTEKQARLRTLRFSIASATCGRVGALAA